MNIPQRKIKIKSDCEITFHTAIIEFFVTVFLLYAQYNTIIRNKKTTVRFFLL